VDDRQRWAEVGLVILVNSNLELLGFDAWSLDKVGVDIGALCGADEPTGVLATNERPDTRLSLSAVQPSNGLKR
jgi:hypothetical protein